jgi:hypothetical protein
LAAEVLSDWAQFQDKFRKEFFREVSTADTAIDWNNLKQEQDKDAVGFFHRVATTVSHFFNKTCGTLKGNDAHTAKKFKLTTTEAASIMAKKAL